MPSKCCHEVHTEDQGAHLCNAKGCYHVLLKAVNKTSTGQKIPPSGLILLRRHRMVEYFKKGSLSGKQLTRRGQLLDSITKNTGTASVMSGEHKAASQEQVQPHRVRACIVAKLSMS
jgi:hypothetical protein